MLRSHGWATDLAPEKEAQLAEEHQPLPFNRRFTFYHPGFNLRSSDLNARIGLSQMRKADHVVARRCENHRIYQSRLGEETGLHCQRNERAQICSISFATIAQTSAQRDRIASLLTEQQIETRPLGGGNMSRQPFWASRYGSIDFPMADRIRSTCFHLPNHPGLQPDDIHHICDVVRSAMADQ